MTYGDIMKSVNGILKDLYPDIRRYDSSTDDGTKTPYFVVEVVPTKTDRQTKNMRERRCTVYITYIQKTPDTVDAYEKMEALDKALGMYLKADTRKLHISGFDMDMIGQKNNIPQYSFDLDWFTCVTKETGDLIEDVTMTVTRKEDNE